MVLIHCKGKSDDHQFLYETTTETPVSTVVRELVEIHNLRLRIQRLKVEGDELAQHGPARHPDKQGLDEDLQAAAPEVARIKARSLPPHELEITRDHPRPPEITRDLIRDHPRSGGAQGGAGAARAEEESAP